MFTITTTATATATTHGASRTPATAPAVPAQGSWYARPGLERATRPLRVTDHDTDHGFCSVCGAVWPCARARREQRTAVDPFAAGA